jgi:hypothetical protein
MRTSRSLARLGAVAAIVGAVIFFVSSLPHPSASAPGDLLAALAEYAASPHWVGIHLGQFAGIAAETTALVALAATFEPDRADVEARVHRHRQALDERLDGCHSVVSSDAERSPSRDRRAE